MALLEAKPGVWRVIIPLGKSSTDGKYRQKWVTVYGPREEAEVAHARLVGPIQLSESPAVTAAMWMQWWMQDESVVRLQQQSVRSYATCVNRVARSSIGAMRLVDVTALDVVEHWKASGLKRPSLLLHHSVWKLALQSAVLKGLLSENVVARIPTQVVGLWEGTAVTCRQCGKSGQDYTHYWLAPDVHVCSTRCRQRMLNEYIRTRSEAVACLKTAQQQLRTVRRLAVSKRASMESAPPLNSSPQ